MYQKVKMKNDFFDMNVPDDPNEAGMIVPEEKKGYDTIVSWEKHVF
jgi:hypothetical protein